MSSNSAVYTSPSYLLSAACELASWSFKEVDTDMLLDTLHVAWQVQMYNWLIREQGLPLCTSWPALGLSRPSTTDAGSAGTNAPADGAVELVVIEAEGVHQGHRIRPHLCQSLHA